MKKLITAAMTFIFAFTCLFSISAFASDEQIQPRASLYFDNYSSEVIPEGGGKISIDVSVKTKMVVKELGFTKVIVQEKSPHGLMLQHSPVLKIQNLLLRIRPLMVLPFLIAGQKAKAIVQR